mmetsp:Transcript_74787/g.178503  ORF Transcript_74787/g.178503 Transcript_74787/m.178503 type:complete len:213 (+) Transcript_74787:1315-1953(+)
MAGCRPFGGRGRQPRPCGRDVSARPHVPGPVSEQGRGFRCFWRHWRLSGSPESLRDGLRRPRGRGARGPGPALDGVHRGPTEPGLQGMATGHRAGGSHVERGAAPRLRRLPAAPGAAPGRVAHVAGEFPRGGRQAGAASQPSLGGKEPPGHAQATFECCAYPRATGPRKLAAVNRGGSNASADGGPRAQQRAQAKGHEGDGEESACSAPAHP